MICLSKAEEGAFKHLEYNQSPGSLAAEHTTRSDLNGIANLREHVAAGQDGEGGCNGTGGGLGGSGDTNEMRLHGGQPPGLEPEKADARRWSKGPSSCLKAVGPAVEYSRCRSRLLVLSPPSLSALWGWVSWLASVLAVSLFLNYLASPALQADVKHVDTVRLAARGLESPVSSHSLLTKRDACETSGVAKKDYNTALHAGALLIIWFISTLACGFPLLAKRLPGLRIPQRFFFVVRHFGTGVLIATAFVHLLPTAFISLGNPCLGDFWNKDYPAIPGAIALAAIFFVSVIEMVFHPARKCSSMPAGMTSDCTTEKKSGTCTRSNGVLQGDGADDEDDTRDTLGEREGESFPLPIRDMQPPRARSGSVGYNLNRLNTIEASDDDTDAGRRPRAGTNKTDVTDDQTTVEGPTELESGAAMTQSVDQKVRKERLQCMLLELGILFHSVFIGMALAVSVGNEFVILLIAIVFHRKLPLALCCIQSLCHPETNISRLAETFEGLALGSRIATIKWTKGNRQPWLMALAYGCTTPIGQAIGIATHSLYSPGSKVGLIVVGVMNAISAGLLTFASLVELLSEDFLSDESWEYLRGKKRVVACVLVFLGAFCMSLVGAWA